MKVDIINLDKKKVGEMELNPEVFAAPLRGDILSRVVHWQLAKRRSGTHAVKERGDVAGSTRKIYKQKGTGGARHGARKGAQFRKGGIIFGPVVRSHAYNLPKKVRQLGLRVALSSKLAANQLYIVDSLAMDTPKTAQLVKAFSQFDIASALFIGTKESNENFLKASANIHTIDFLLDAGANVYDIIRKNALFLTREAVASLEARLA